MQRKNGEGKFLFVGGGGACSCVTLNRLAWAPTQILDVAQHVLLPERTLAANQCTMVMLRVTPRMCTTVSLGIPMPGLK